MGPLRTDARVTIADVNPFGNRQRNREPHILQSPEDRMRRYTRFLSLSGLIAFGLSACASDPTASPDARADAVVGASSENATTVLTDSHWETWGIATFFICTGAVLQGGSYHAHLQSTYVTRPDGSRDIRYHINSAQARGVDSNGTEYVFHQVGNGTQMYLPTGPYTVVETQNFRLISPGSDVNYLLAYTVTITSDGVNAPVVTFDLLKNECPG